jgi:hypothetical protein
MRNKLQVFTPCQITIRRESLKSAGTVCRKTGTACPGGRIQFFGGVSYPVSRMPERHYAFTDKIRIFDKN